MFNIIATLNSVQNYFTHELLHNNLSSEVAHHFNVHYWRPYLVVSCLEEVFLPASAAPVDPPPYQLHSTNTTSYAVPRLRPSSGTEYSAPLDHLFVTLSLRFLRSPYLTKF